MQLPEFKKFVKAKFTELESMPCDGDEFPESAYEVNGVKRMPVFDESEFLDYCANVVRQVYIQAAAFGFLKDPPATLMSRDDARYYLQQISAWCEGQKTNAGTYHGPDSGPLTAKQVADRLGVSAGKVYQLCRDGIMPHNRIGTRVVITSEHLQTFLAENPTYHLKTSGFGHLT